MREHRYPGHVGWPTEYNTPKGNTWGALPVFARI